MVSSNDERINATSLLKTLDTCLKNKKVKFLEDKIINIRRTKNQWIATSKNNQEIKSEIIILCNSLDAIDLIDSLSHNIK